MSVSSIGEPKMGRRRFAAIQYAKFEERRRNSAEFPEYCPTCDPERRFKELVDLRNHDRDKNGICSIERDELSTFVQNAVEPNTKYIKRCKTVIRRLVLFIQEKCRPEEVLKSGSLGKGTAVKGKSDVDLVVFLDRSLFDSMETFRNKITTILQDMETSLRTARKCKITGTTKHAVKVSISCHGHTHDVDILPSIKILGDGTDSEVRRAVYQEMRDSTESDREYYSAALACLQIEFVRYRPAKLKTLIRLVKYWRKTFFKESTGLKRLPSSYLLELITIGEWESHCKKDNFDLRIGFYKILKALEDFRSLRHLWKENYSENDVDSDLTLSCYVMDPANPFNNVMDACTCWHEVAQKAKMMLAKPLFHGLSGTESWG